MFNSTVILTRCEEYEPGVIAAKIRKHFELLGGIRGFIKSGDRVLLKPNFIAPRTQHHATQTHPAIIIEAAKLLKDFGAKPFVGDSPAWGNVYSCAKKLRLDEPLKRLNIPIVQLNKGRKCHIGQNNTAIGISSTALDADVIINLAKFKSHQQLVATFAVKNMFGAICGKRKALWHFRRGKTAEQFCTLLIDIYKFLNPALTIIDAVDVMDGAGPIRGRTRPLGWIISGVEPISLEITCCKLINLDCNQLPIIKAAKRMGFGCSKFEEITYLGDDFSKDICTDFQIPKLIPIRFSLAHVCKSIAKQMVLLTKSALRTGTKKR